MPQDFRDLDELPLADAEATDRLPRIDKPTSRRNGVNKLQHSGENGVNVGILLAARDAIAKAPQRAKFTWLVRSDWITGAHTRSE